MVSRGREPAVVVPLLKPTGKLLFWFDPFGQLMQGGEKGWEELYPGQENQRHWPCEV